MKTLFQETEMFKFHSSQLYDQDTFYRQFHKDISRAHKRLIVESLFITTRRVASLLPILTKFHRRGANIVINTKPFSEHTSGLLDCARISSVNIRLATDSFLILVKI